MINIFFEIDRLRTSLEAKNVDTRTINSIAAKARNEIISLIEREGEQSIQEAVEIGVDARSVDFINELRLDMVHQEVTTDSGLLDFSTPPKPMLPFLLNNAKVTKDGSGLYKVIPIGKHDTGRPPISNSIHDAQRRITAERAEQAKARQKQIAPKDSQVFRTATSKQNPGTDWVLPAQKKDFTEAVQEINNRLHARIEGQVRDIIDGYIDMY